jgi:nickel-dependent lactate racemase
MEDSPDLLRQGEWLVNWSDQYRRGSLPTSPCWLSSVNLTLCAFSSMPWFTVEQPSISRLEMESACHRLIEECRSRLCPNPKRVLLLPPDRTRAHSGAGWITETLFSALTGTSEVHVIPTLGQHVPHTTEENRWMFGAIPERQIHAHDWRGGVARVGAIPARLVAETTNGIADWDIPIDLNKSVINGGWDWIIHIGHVVPHEVLGFANHNKNYFIGLGGKETLCASHIAAGVYGIEKNLGCVVTPLRACFNWAEQHFLSHLPDVYFQVVMRRDDSGNLVHCGAFVGDDLETYLQAARKSQAENITLFPKPLKKVVAVMQGDEFFSTWVANKAVYRTRMAMANGGELLIIAPGLKRFGEQPEIDQLIRKYGYDLTDRILQLWKQNADLQDLGNGTAHLLHGTSDRRFTIRYAPGKLFREEIEGVHYEYADLSETLKRYSPEKMQEGWNRLPDGEEVFFINTPSAGLWAVEERMRDRRDFTGVELS